MRLIFMCCINFCYNTYFIPEASLPIKDDADLGSAVPFLQHVQPPGVAERGLDLAQVIVIYTLMVSWWPGPSLDPATGDSDLPSPCRSV